MHAAESESLDVSGLSFPLSLEAASTLLARLLAVPCGLLPASSDRDLQLPAHPPVISVNEYQAW